MPKYRMLRERHVVEELEVKAENMSLAIELANDDCLAAIQVLREVEGDPEVNRATVYEVKE